MTSSDSSKNLKQELYNKVKKHLLAQGKPAMGARGDCQYRTEEGLSCAIGCLIPDEDYDVTIEGWTPSAYLSSEASSFPFRGREKLNEIVRKLGVSTSEDTFFLLSLQRIHDAEVPERWGGALMTLAAVHGLDP